MCDINFAARTEERRDTLANNFAIVTCTFSVDGNIG